MLKIYHWTIRHLGSGQFLWLWCLSFSVVDWTNTPGTKHSEGIFDEVLATALSIQVILQVVEIGKIVRRSSMVDGLWNLWHFVIFTACIVGMMSRLVSLTTYPVSAAQDFAGVLSRSPYIIHGSCSKLGTLHNCKILQGLMFDAKNCQSLCQSVCLFYTVLEPHPWTRQVTSYLHDLQN